MAKKIKISLADLDKDGSNRIVLDSPEKIVFWIEYQLEKQQQKAKEQQRSYLYIDLSNCVICTDFHNQIPSMTNLNEIAGKISCVKKVTDEKNNKYHQEVLLPFFCKNSILYTPFFHQTKFHGDIFLDETKLVGGGSFSLCSFKGSFYGQKTDFGQCDFSFSKFHKGVIFTKAEFSGLNIDFSRCTFHDEVRLNSIKISEPKIDYMTSLSFYQSVFHKSFSMNGVVLERVCTFEECQFHGNISLNKINSNNDIFFTSTSIYKHMYVSIEEENIKCHLKKIILTNSTLYGRIDIEGYKIDSIDMGFTKIESQGILRFYNCKIRDLDMQSICNMGIIFFEDNKNEIKSITLQSAINVGFIEIEDTAIPEIINRKTAQLLKDSALKSNNSIDAIKYKRLEAKAFEKEKEIQWHEKLLVLLNGCSNRHGTSWVRALWMTACITLVFSILILCLGIESAPPLTMHINDIDWRIFAKTFISLLDIVNFGGSLKDLSLNIYGYYLQFFAKIFIAYGYYQFISAFRKYGR